MSKVDSRGILLRIRWLIFISVCLAACSFTPAATNIAVQPTTFITNTPGGQVTVAPILTLLPPATATTAATTEPTREATPEITPEITPEVTPEITPERTPVVLPDAIGPYEFADNINPLTGLAVDDPAQLNHRPIVAKISNAPPLVRPQDGVGLADMVFEHYAEGGLTRFSAVFYSHLPDRVGSIRSARLIDNEVVPMYGGLLIYSGASNGVNQIIDSSDFAGRTYMGIRYGFPHYYRDESIAAPHNMFSNAAAISQLATEAGINERPMLNGMAFHPDPPPNPVSDANLIDIRYIATRVQWQWDAENGVYRRISDGQPHYDATTEQQVTADNVVVIFSEHHFTDIIESEWQGSVSYSLEMKLWFEGDALLFRDGKRYDVRWWRPTREDMIRLLTVDGDYMYFKPGNTWYQVVRTPEQQDPNEEGVAVE
jgi:hypothetical protein